MLHVSGRLPVAASFHSLLLLLSLSMGETACSSSSSSSTAPSATDAGTSTDASSADSAAPAPGTDASVPAPTKGLTISDATVASINGTYDIVVSRISVPAGLAFNGNFNDKIEIEIDTDAAGIVKTAHVWTYPPGGTTGPDKYYGCDGKATACAGVTVDVTTNLITIAHVTWPEVNAVMFDGTPDTLVASGAKVTVTAQITATK